MAKDSSISSLHNIAQHYSNLNMDKSDILREVHRIKRSTEAEGNLEKNEETSQILTMHDVRKLLEKETGGAARIVNQTKRETEGIKDLVKLEQQPIDTRKSTGKMIQKINKEVIQMKSSIENVSTQVEETQQEIQEKIQKVEQIATKAENSANKMRNEIESYKSSKNSSKSR